MARAKARQISVADVELTLTTGVGHARATNRQACGQLLGFGCPTTNPYQVALYGRQFSGMGATCNTWSSATGGAMVVPALILDEFVSGSLSPSRTDLTLSLRAVQQ